jgi:hypothetical protein
MTPEFVIVVPTIRQGLDGFRETIEALQESLTRDTDFQVVDGTGGKVAALNRAYDEVLLKTAAPIYVTLDDDFIPPRGWQDAVVETFEQFPQVGVVCPWPGDDQRWTDYVGLESVGPWMTKGRVKCRMLKPWRHIPGCLLAFRRETVIAMGKTPQSKRRYDIYEDCWRGRMAYKRGWRSMYVDVGPCRIFDYIDSDDYIAHKADAIDESRLESAGLLASFGLADPLSWRLRRWVARVRGRDSERANSARDIQEQRRR